VLTGGGRQVREVRGARVEVLAVTGRQDEDRSQLSMASLSRMEGQSVQWPLHVLHHGMALLECDIMARGGG
jgi:hypothetical protein